MRALLQRVSSAAVRVRDPDGTSRETGRIGLGFLVFVGFTHADTNDHVEWMADKVAGLRVFGDDAGKMNKAMADVGGGLLVVSQFTLYGNANDGRRPSFIAAAPREIAVPLYERFLGSLRARSVSVASGEFGASMEVELVNDGPVTIWLER